MANIANMANEADEWKKPHFRQKVTNQIDEALRKSGNPQNMTKKAAEIERDVFSKAKSRDEYMCYVARVLVYFARDLGAGRGQPGVRPGAQPGQPGQVVNVSQMGTRPHQMQPGIPVSQALRPQYSVTQISTAAPMTSVANVQYQVKAPQMPFKNLTANMVGQQTQIMNQQTLAGQTSQSQQQFVTNSQPMQVQQTAMLGPSATVSAHQPHPSTQISLPQHGQQSYGVSTTGAVSHQMQYVPSSMSTSVQSPMPNTGIRVHTPNPSPANQAVAPSPAFNPLHSPAPGMMPSPQQFVAQSPATSSVPTPGTINVQSPASILNPASVGPPVTSPAPFSAAEEQAYLEKHKQLSMYIEPLTRMINRMNKDQEHSNNDRNKLKNFLDILENPARRVPLNVLERCEQVLKKLNLKPPTQRSNTVSPSPTTLIQSVTTVKPSSMTMLSNTKSFVALSSEEQSQQISGQALLDTIVKHLKSPLFSHTLKRTFSPIVQSMEGPPICPPPPPSKRLRISEVSTKKCPLPHTLQGELARLCDRFTVKPEMGSSSSQSSTLLRCSIHDEFLPAVPPIEVTVPQNYPHSSPACKTKAYESTPFLLKIQSQLSSELRRMPGFYSVTSLLNAWEASIRLACLSEVTVS